MPRARLFRTLAVTAIASATLWAAAPSFAQTGTATPAPTLVDMPAEAEITGTVDSVTSTTLMIGGMTFDIRRAELNYSGTLATGQLVKVHALPTGPGTWVAREVERVGSVGSATPAPGATPAPSLRAGEFELTGILESLDGMIAVVSGQTIDLSSAEIYGTLTPGQVVDVHLRRVNGVWIAREIERSELDGRLDVTRTAISAARAEEITLGVFPNTTITEIELQPFSNGALVWNVYTSHGYELYIDAQTGTIYAIDQSGRDSGDDRDENDDSADDNNDRSGDDSSSDSNDDSNDDSSNDSNDDSNDDSGSDDSDDGHDDHGGGHDDDHNDDSDDD